MNSLIDANINEILCFVKLQQTQQQHVPNGAQASLKKPIKHIIEKCKYFFKHFNIEIDDSLETFIKQAFDKDYEKCTLHNFLQFCCESIDK